MKKITFLFALLFCTALNAQVTSAWTWTKFDDAHFYLEQQQDYASGAQTLRHPMHFYDSTKVAIDTGYTFYLGKTSTATFPLSSFLLMNPTTRQLQLKSADSLRITTPMFVRSSNPTNGQSMRWNTSTSAWEWYTPASTTTITNVDNVSRSLNSNYTISSNTRGCFVTYSINASWTINALLSGTGSAFLEYSTNNGSSWITVSQVSKTLSLLTVAGGDDMNLAGFVPSTATTTRIRTTATNMTISYVRGQETKM